MKTALLFLTMAAFLGLGPHAAWADGPKAPHRPSAEAAARPNPNASDAESRRRGEALYGKHCVDCHGATGKGDGPRAGTMKPRPANLARWMPRKSDGTAAWYIAEGIGPMPAWEGTLSEAEIWDVVSHLRQGVAAPAPK